MTGQGARAIGVAIVTISDKASRGEREDLGGPAIRERVLGADILARVAEERIVPDDPRTIRDTLVDLAGRDGVDVILTTGGTGLAPRDTTPQATREAIEYEVPGIAEALRAESLRYTPAAMLSRGIAGVRNRRLIVNLPGNPKAIAETLPLLLPALPHAVSTLHGDVGDHTPPKEAGE